MIFVLNVKPSLKLKINSILMYDMKSVLFLDWWVTIYSKMSVGAARGASGWGIGEKIYHGTCRKHPFMSNENEQKCNNKLTLKILYLASLKLQKKEKENHVKCNKTLAFDYLLLIISANLAGRIFTG